MATLPVAELEHRLAASGVASGEGGGAPLRPVRTLQELIGAGVAVPSTRTPPLRRVLPVPEPLVPLFPDGGLARGEITVVESPALLAALLAPSIRERHWAALVGHPTFALDAAAQAGVDLARVVVVRLDVVASAMQAGADRSIVATSVAALVDAVPLVVLGPQAVGAFSTPLVRRLAARARERGTVLLLQPGVADITAWSDAVGLRVWVEGRHWSGLGDGHGHLQAWEAEVRSHGRRSAARVRSVRCALQETLLPVSSIGTHTAGTHTADSDGPYLRRASGA